MLGLPGLEQSELAMANRRQRVNLQDDDEDGSTPVAESGDRNP